MGSLRRVVPLLVAGTVVGCYSSGAGGQAAIDAGIDGGRAPDAELPRCVDLVAGSGCSSFSCPGDTKCHVFCATPLSWDDARAACQSMGGEMATVESPTEQTCLAAILAAETVGWVGLHQDPTSGFTDTDWTWVTGRPAAIDWEMLEPNDAGNTLDYEDHEEDCGVLRNGRIFDYGCDELHGFFCDGG